MSSSFSRVSSLPRYLSSFLTIWAVSLPFLFTEGKRSTAVHTSVSATDCTLPDARPPVYQRLFTSVAVEQTIATLQPKFKDPNLGQLFANTLPNVLDTTLYHHVPPSANYTGDTFIITGDIPAQWSRDSTNQVLPYLRFLSNDIPLRNVVAGLIARHARSILIDPYANAFQIDSSAGQGPHADDSTSRPAFAGTTIDAMTPAIFERKWELDSLANPLRLAYLYYNVTGDIAPFDATWLSAVTLAIDTMDIQRLDTEQEDNNGGPPYVFQRTTGEPSDTLEHGRGSQAKYTGLIKCAFRGSDDALQLPFNIPENAFAVVALREISLLLTVLNQTTLANRAATLATEVDAAIQTYGTFIHPTIGQRVYAYELDGFGNYFFADDANIPSLLAMPYYGYVSVNDTLYQATRSAVLSSTNPYYFCGSACCGIGGPHNGPYWIWPMALISQAWTSTDDNEIASLLDILVQASACTGLVHESFDHNSFGSYTRPWFAWVNGLMADLVLKIADERPYLIF